MNPIYRKGYPTSNGNNYYFKITDKETITVCDFNDAPSIDVIAQSLEYPLENSYKECAASEFTNTFLLVLQMLKSKL